MRNHIYEVDWNYPDQIGSEWRDLHQYIVVYNSESELGKVIDKNLYEGDEMKYETELANALLVAFGIRSNEVAFYYETSKEMTEDELKEAIKSDANIIITQVYAKYYEGEE